MKTLQLLLALVLMPSMILLAQFPNAFKYQGVMRDDEGLPMSNRDMNIRISLLEGTSHGTEIYSETHFTRTNYYGLINLEIGLGTTESGEFKEIKWGTNSYFIKVEVDFSGGTDYHLMGTSQLYSVPYAFYAENAGSLLVDKTHSPVKSVVNNSGSIQNGYRSNGQNCKISSDGDSFFNANTGNTGVGTNSPVQKLDVSGNINLVADSAIMIDNMYVLHNRGDRNFFVGDSAGLKNTTGFDNSALGYKALKLNVDGIYNTSVGSSALEFNTSGTRNTGVGAFALMENTSGMRNTALGTATMLHNTEGNWNTALGMVALRDNITGSDNIAIGYQALFNNTTGWKSIAIGNYALASQTGDPANDTMLNIAIGYKAMVTSQTGKENAAVGHFSLENNTDGNWNSALGTWTLQLNTSGFHNVAVGYAALNLNTIGNYNTAVGAYALADNDTGILNVACGAGALLRNTYGNLNTGIGYTALRNNTTGSNNTACGYRALRNNTTGWNSTAVGYKALFSQNGHASDDSLNNTAVGYEALFSCNPTSGTNGRMNVAIGHQALYSDTTGHSNTAVGYLSMFKNMAGNYNTAVGDSSLSFNDSGVSNTAIGFRAGETNTDGNDNTCIGAFSDVDGTSFHNASAFGFDTHVTASDMVRIGNGSVTSIGGYADWTTVLPDERFCTNVEESLVGLDFIKKLRPVNATFDVEALDGHLGNTNHQESGYYENLEKSKIIYTGFIAQEVEEITHEMGIDFSGVYHPKNEKDLYGLRYATFVVPLVKAVQEQQSQIEKLEHRITELEKLLESN